MTNGAWKATLQKHREQLIHYLEVKMEIEDWHAVSDAANDLREVDAALEMWSRLIPEVELRDWKAEIQG